MRAKAVDMGDLGDGRSNDIALSDDQNYYREVQLDFPSEMEVLFMLFERCHNKNRKRSIKQQIKYFNFRS